VKASEAFGALGNGGFCCASLPEEDSRFLPLFEQLCYGIDDLTKRNRVLLSLVLPEIPPLLFWFLGGPNEFVSVVRVRRIVKYLRGQRDTLQRFLSLRG
jgi:hypothetical protein